MNSLYDLNSKFFGFGLNSLYDSYESKSSKRSFVSFELNSLNTSFFLLFLTIF